MKRLTTLIKQIETSALIQKCAPGVTARHVQAIIDYGHIHFEPAYPGMPVSNEVATVCCPDHSAHVVQVAIDEPGSPKNHLCCTTCYDPRAGIYCAAAVAAFVIKLASRPALRRRDVCPGCEEVLG